MTAIRNPWGPGVVDVGVTNDEIALVALTVSDLNEADGTYSSSATIGLGLMQLDQLIAELTARRIDVIRRLSGGTERTQDSRPSASPVAEGRAQTAPDGAGAAPTGETSALPLADDPDGHTRTTAAGPSTPPAGPGRPISHHDGPDGVWCRWSGATSKTGACPEGHELPGYIEPGRPTLASMLGNARGELLANSTLIGPAGGEVR